MKNTSLTFIVALLFLSSVSTSLRAADPSTSPSDKTIALRKLGNEQYEEKNYLQAAAFYSVALKDELCPLTLQNRGMAYVKLGLPNDAEKDFLQALAIDPKLTTAKFWLGQIYADQNRFAKAIYFLQLAREEKPESRATNKLITATQKRYDAIADAHFANRRTIDQLKAMRHAIHEGPRLGLDLMSPFALKNKKFKKINELSNALSAHFGRRFYSPLNRSEHPQSIAAWIGKGKRIATVIVQTLPYYFSMYFDDVRAYDISPPQIAFHTLITRAHQRGALKKFVEDEANKFESFIKELNDPDIKIKRAFIDVGFDDVYQPLFSMTTHHKISARELNIFDAVNNESKDTIHDVVFLSTIPSLENKTWPTMYKHIRNWVQKGKTVVYTLLYCEFADLTIMRELTSGFEEIADMEFTQFDMSVGTIHVKITPKKDRKLRL